MKIMFLIIKREYLYRVRNKFFIIITLLMPLIMLGLIVGPYFLANIKDNNVKKIIILDETNKYVSLFKSSPQVVYEGSSLVLDSLRTQIGDDLYAIIRIKEDPVVNPHSVEIYSRKQVPTDIIEYVKKIISDKVRSISLNEIMSRYNINSATVDEIQQASFVSNIQINTFKIDDNGGDKKTSVEITSIIGILFSMLIYIFIITYGAIVMQGVVEEKTSRIVEIMVSSVRPFYLMLGKIIGIGLVGLTQFFVMLLMFSSLYVFKNFIPFFNNSEDVSQLLLLLNNLNWGQIIPCFIIYFIGGYMIFASLFAMFASAVDNVQDTQQFMMPMMLVIMFALYAGIYSVKNPDGPLAFWCSMIPFTSPIVMIMRIPFGVSWIQLLASFGILVASIIVITKMAAKIYRVGILMYGKKPSFKELFKWMSYK